MAGGVAVCVAVVLWPAQGVAHPALGAVLVHVFRVAGEEALRLGPQSGDALGRVVNVDGEAIGLVVVLHVAEYVVVDVAEEVHLRLHPPVPARAGQRWVLVEEAAVPAAHLVVRDHIRVLDVVLLQDQGRLEVQVLVDPAGDLPVLFRNDI